jgi:monovalent cation/hydrogen antiporter
MPARCQFLTRASDRNRVTDTQLNVTISLLTGCAAYLPADARAARDPSHRHRGHRHGHPRTADPPYPHPLGRLPRLDTIDLIVNRALLVLIGLQLHAVISHLSA